MPRRTGWRVCSKPGCPQYTDQGGRCEDHRREAEQRRGSARQRGYGGEHEQRFRPGVLAKDPTCVCAKEAHEHPAPCGQPSKHADHYPRSRRELAAAGLDANDPQYGRGLCGPCHSKATAEHQPGGFNA